MQPSLENMTPEKWQQLKAQDRARDRQRIASGEATPEQIQMENEIFSHEAIKLANWDMKNYMAWLDSQFSDAEIDAMC